MLQYLAAGLCVTLVVPVALVKCTDKGQSSIPQVHTGHLALAECSKLMSSTSTTSLLQLCLTM